MPFDPNKKTASSKSTGDQGHGP